MESEASSQRISITARRNNHYGSILKKDITFEVSCLSKNPPSCTAIAWSIHRADNGGFLWGRNETFTTEIASLTKIMTAYLSIQLANYLKIDFKSEYVKVSKRASLTGGTRAGLIQNSEIKLIDLLYGLLLPSGNDASIALAEYFGQKALEYISKFPQNAKFENPLFKISLQNLDDFVQIFVKLMNRLAKLANLRKSKFSNPHGLPDKANTSNCIDLGKLISIARKEEIIKEIVSTMSYECYGSDEKGNEIKYKWMNTNILLNKGFDGFKTGTTPTAGACLIGTCTIKKIFPIVIIILQSKTSESRWEEMKKLRQWAEIRLETFLEISANKLFYTERSNISKPMKGIESIKSYL